MLLIPIFILEVIFLFQLVVNVHEALVVNSELELVTMLSEHQHVLRYSHLVVEELPEGLLFVNERAIPEKSLLSCYD
jgi:hypothetical protein